MKSKGGKYDVLVAGELNMDLILAGMDNLPQRGKEILAPEMSLTLGSSSAIFASNLAVLGTSVCFIGKIGKDSFGNQVVKSLAEKGVEVSQITYSDTAKTGLTVALSYENERAMVTYPGAMLELKEEDITGDLLQSCSHLHVSSIFMQPALKKGMVPLFQRAKKAGLTTSLDTQWDPDEKWDCDWENLLPLVDVFMPNLEELKNITGQKEPEACINKIKDWVNIVVVKDGINGSIIWNNGEIFKQPVFINTQVKDTIGAGDSFNAGFIHQFIKDKPLKDCSELAAICGAVNTTFYGGTTAFNSKENVQKIALQQFNYHVNDL